MIPTAMNLVVDNGNTRTKFAVFDDDRMVVSGVADGNSFFKELFKSFPVENIMVSNVGKKIGIRDAAPEGVRFFELTSELPLPVRIDYETPETLGPDRLAAVVGAMKICPGRNCLVIDAGTCITIDFIDSKAVYHGGAILPGLSMKFNALHTFTEKLPLLKVANSDSQPGLIGKSTAQSIFSGVVNGTVLELDGFVNQYKVRFDDLKVLITGGDSEFLEKHLNFDHLQNTELAFAGLNEILKYNEKNA